MWPKKQTEAAKEDQQVVLKWCRAAGQGGIQIASLETSGRHMKGSTSSSWDKTV